MSEKRRTQGLQQNKTFAVEERRHGPDFEVQLRFRGVIQVVLPHFVIERTGYLQQEIRENSLDSSFDFKIAKRIAYNLK